MNKKLNIVQVQNKDYPIHYINCNDLDTKIYTINSDLLPNNLEQFRELIPADRYYKMLKYRRDIDRKLLVGNEILFDYGMKQLGTPEGSKGVKRNVNEAGKPYIVGIEQQYFNMSHAGSYSVCAFSNKPVGVDIELINPIDMLIAEQYYCKEEYEDILNKPKDLQLKRFYQYWVLKESFTKAVGLGLSIPIDSFRFYERTNNLLGVRHSIDRHEYLSSQFSFDNNRYEMAVCVQAA